MTVSASTTRARCGGSPSDGRAFSARWLARASGYAARAAGYGALTGAAADLWLVAIPAALSGRHDPSVSAHAHAMADAAAGAAAPLVLVGALLGVLAAALRKSAQRPRKANAAGSDHHDFDDNGNDDRPRGG